MDVSSEVTSSYVGEKDDELELGLGLSIGGGGLKSKSGGGGGNSWVGQYARILTAKDFGTNNNNCCSSSSNSGGTKRSATDSVSPPSVVGWPPVSKAHRILAKSPTENHISVAEQNKSTNRTIGVKDYSDERKVISNSKYRSVKVNMDGAPIGRKVDLNSHTSYETLAQTLEEMFWTQRSSTVAARPSRLLDGTSEFVLTYEDKDGDCMLVGDVPWQMFLSSVKRLRIMKNSESNGLASSFQDNNERHRSDAV